MAYFLDKEKNIGEIATFASPLICESANQNELINKEDISLITIKFLGKEFSIYVDRGYLEEYNIPITASDIEVDEDDENSMNFFFGLKPIRPSILKKYIEEIGVQYQNEK